MKAAGVVSGMELLHMTTRHSRVWWKRAGVDAQGKAAESWVAARPLLARAEPPRVVDEAYLIDPELACYADPALPGMGSEIPSARLRDLS